MIGRTTKLIYAYMKAKCELLIDDLSNRLSQYMTVIHFGHVGSSIRRDAPT